ncbi:hypothetical protein KR018_007488 [Drosophila ironensis]|nr:hypothetical protein KR018_007488 [Drosophila ironensis]
MSSVHFFKTFSWLLLHSICMVQVGAAPPLPEESLQQLLQLDLSQAKLASDNATAKCIVTPDLCDWQLHLYEGHAFSAPLSPATTNPAPTVPASPSPSPSPAAAPLMPAPEVFHINPPDGGSQLFIVAEVERRREQAARRKRKLRRRTTFNYSPKRKFVLLVFQ